MRAIPRHETKAYGHYRYLELQAPCQTFVIGDAQATKPAHSNVLNIRVCSCTRRTSCFQNRVTSVKWKLVTFIAGTTMSKASSPEARTEGDNASTLFSRSMIPWLKRKFFRP